jgi:hypothetical protein
VAHKRRLLRPLLHVHEMRRPAVHRVHVQQGQRLCLHLRRQVQQAPPLGDDHHRPARVRLHRVEAAVRMARRQGQGHHG